MNFGPCAAGFETNQLCDVPPTLNYWSSLLAPAKWAAWWMSSN